MDCNMTLMASCASLVQLLCMDMILLQAEYGQHLFRDIHAMTSHQSLVASLQCVSTAAQFNRLANASMHNIAALRCQSAATFIQLQLASLLMLRLIRPAGS